MTNRANDSAFLPIDIDWSMLSALSKVMKYDALAGTLTIEVGASRATLREDGTITLAGKRLIQDVTDDIHLLAGRIELN